MSEDLSFQAADSSPDGAAQDLVWMDAVKQGDTEAFRLLIEAHQHRVVGTIAKMLGGELEAEDLAQQVFIRVWKSAPRYEPTAKFTTWLFKITRNLVFNELRRRKRHGTQSLDAEPEEDRAPLQAVDHASKAPDANGRGAAPLRRIHLRGDRGDSEAVSARRQKRPLPGAHGAEGEPQAVSRGVSPEISNFKFQISNRRRDSTA